MSQNLCSKKFRTFFNAIETHAGSVKSIIRIIQKEFPRIAEDFPIGKLMLQTILPQTILDEKGGSDSYELYLSPDGYAENQAYIERFLSVDGKADVITAYAKKGHIWTSDEQETLRFLAQNIYLFESRAQFFEMTQEMSNIDLLTGASNNQSFLRYGDALFARGELAQYTCCFINIKNFNYINQTVGPRLGDAILKEYAQRIQAQLQPEELLSRIGGDNFIALLKTTHMDAFLDFMSDIKIHVPRNSQIHTFDIRARIGICAITESQTMADVINAVYVALNVAQTGNMGDYIWFQPEMLEQALHEKEISLIFPKALQAQEFVVYYQPKVTLSDNQLCGCEALVRWFRHGKLVPPMDFIPILEKEGTVCQLDFYVLDRVCQDIHQWLEQGIQPVRVSVNFSRMHLRNPNLSQDIVAVLQKYHIDSKYIEVELTEMSGYENYETLFTFVQQMKENGIYTSIDDFGTGYSSLHLLKDLNVDVIKLDKSFLKNLESRRDSDIIVIKNIVHMVNELDMAVIAEGVETPMQAGFLKNIHCCMAQGFLFDRPLPHDDFEQRLAKQRTYTIAS